MRALLLSSAVVLCACMGSANATSPKAPDCTGDCSFGGKTTLADVEATGHLEAESFTTSNMILSTAGNGQRAFGQIANSKHCFGIDVNGSCGDYLTYQPGFGLIASTSNFVVVGSSLTLEGFAGHIDAYGDNGIWNSAPSTPTLFDDPDGIQLKPQTLPTCTAGPSPGREGREFVDASAGGLSSGHRTRRCWCTSDGAGNGAWQNMVTGTLGTTTTCPD